jgi:hypothetical protein
VGLRGFGESAISCCLHGNIRKALKTYILIRDVPGTGNWPMPCKSKARSEHEFISQGLDISKDFGSGISPEQDFRI